MDRAPLNEYQMYARPAVMQASTAPVVSIGTRTFHRRSNRTGGTTKIESVHAVSIAATMPTAIGPDARERRGVSKSNFACTSMFNSNGKRPTAPSRSTDP